MVCRCRSVSESQLLNFQKCVRQLFHNLNYITLKTKVLNTQNSSLPNYFTVFYR